MLAKSWHAICQRPSNQTGDWNGLKRLCRYLKGVPRLVWRYHDQLEQDRFTMLTDSDDAGCAKTRKSTSAGPGALMHSSHLIIFLFWNATFDFFEFSRI